jgi:hypothetical protein
VGLYTAGLRFLFVKTLKRPYPFEERFWCKLRPTVRSVKLRLVESLRMGSSCECRVPQFRHRRVAPAEFARLELLLLDLFC